MCSSVGVRLLGPADKQPCMVSPVGVVWGGGGSRACVPGRLWGPLGPPRQPLVSGDSWARYAVNDVMGCRACSGRLACARDVRNACGVVASPRVRVLGFPGQLVGEDTRLPQLCFFGGEVHP